MALPLLPTRMTRIYPSEKVKSNEDGVKRYDNSHVLRIIREWVGMRQKEFGEAVGKSERMIQDYESGAINFNYALLREIVDRFSITLVAYKNGKNIL